MKKFIAVAIMCFSTLLHSGMPSVAQVFGGMSEEEITAQVKMGQQFLEDLEKYGTPEDKAQFEQLLLETLNSMSPDDFNDIQNIAKMVEPHLDLPPLPEDAAPTIETTPIAPTPVQVAPKGARSDVEALQQLINTIVSRIDEILQKLSSSKEASEIINIHWSSKATLNSMKRQIYQLATPRLAQKLTSKSISAEDKSLVQALEQFLKDLTQANDSLRIQDDFGLPTSATVDQQHIRQAHDITNMLDTYIDSLMPKLEKFLRQWDPEALQLAQEAQARATAAQDNAKKAQTRVPSANAQPLLPQQQNTNAQRSTGYGRGADYSDYYGSDSDDYYGSPQQSGSTAPSTLGTPGGQQSSPQSQAQSKESSAQAAIAKSKKETSVGAYQEISDALEDHLATFDAAHEQKFLNFLKKDLPDIQVVDDYGIPVVNTSGEQAVPQFTALNWVNGNYAIYRNNILDQLRNKFSKEFKAAASILEDANKAVKDMSADELKKAERIQGLGRLTQRYNTYKQAYEAIKPQLQVVYDRNLKNISDFDAQRTFQSENQNFMNHLKVEIEDQIETVQNELEHLKRKIRRQTNRKSATQDTASSRYDIEV